VQGKLIYAGDDAWDGILDDKPARPCTQRLPLHKTSRIVAGAPIEGGIYKCALKPVEQAVMDGTYAPRTPSAQQVATLKQIFPTGVCDYSKPDRARPDWLLWPPAPLLVEGGRPEAGWGFCVTRGPGASRPPIQLLC
jgi:hypothetical protein